MSAAGVMDGMPPGFVSPAAFWFAVPHAGGADPVVPPVPTPTTKTSGMGDNFYIGGNDISGDVSTLSKISGLIQTLNVTSINEFAMERLGGHRDGLMDFVVYFNPTRAHPVLSALPTTDTLATYCRGQAVGNPVASLLARQINYDPTRPTDGSLTAAVNAVGDGFGLEWGRQLTPGLRSDSAATSGPAIDDGALSSFGFQAYLQMTAFTGADVTVKLQDSGDGINFTDLASGAFAQTTGAQTFQRIAGSGTAVVRRFVRAVTVTSGGFTLATFNVAFVRNLAAVSF